MLTHDQAEHLNATIDGLIRCAYQMGVDSHLITTAPELFARSSVDAAVSDTRVRHAIDEATRS